MISIQVSDMTCGHCVSSVTKAVQAVDDGAQVRIDLATHRVEIGQTEATAADLISAIKEAGYTPIVIDSHADAPASGCASGASGCCGCS